MLPFRQQPLVALLLGFGADRARFGRFFAEQFFQAETATAVVFSRGREQAGVELGTNQGFGLRAYSFESLDDLRHPGFDITAANLVDDSAKIKPQVFVPGTIGNEYIRGNADQ